LDSNLFPPRPFLQVLEQETNYHSGLNLEKREDGFFPWKRSCIGGKELFSWPNKVFFIFKLFIE
jgi:hypothetical protein